MRHLPLGLLLAAAALAAPDRASADPHLMALEPIASLPPGRVGRLAEVSGNVELQPAGATGWAAAERNDPVAAGAAVRSGAQSRASIEIGADSLDLVADSEIRVAALDDDAFGLVPVRGHLRLALHRRGGGVEIDLTRGSLRLERPGLYQFDAASDNPLRLAVLAGGARFLAAGAIIGIEPGEAAVLTDTAPLALTIAPAGGGNIAVWKTSANDSAPGSATDFASPDMTGLAALDRAGEWRRIAGYGEGWLPDGMPTGWVPYRDGHWRWFPPWGWTWIDDAPWGFAPSHYGRWAMIGKRWAWLPGRLVAHPVYLPAAVAFIGTPGIGVSYAGGKGPAIGWFPLAPGEVYWPSYTDDLDYLRAANCADVADFGAIGGRSDSRMPVEVVDRAFANRLAASVVPRTDFIAGRTVSLTLLDLPTERLREMPVIMGSPRIAAPAPSSVAASRAAPSWAPAAAVAGKRAAWLKTVRLAAIRSQRYQQALRLRRVVLRFGGAISAAPGRPHRLAALRLAHRVPDHNRETSQ